MHIPNELINLILSFRGMHPVSKIFCCDMCGDNDYLRITKLRLLYGQPKRLKIMCENCIYYDNKD